MHERARLADGPNEEADGLAAEPPGRLPTPRASLIGREGDVAAVAARLLEPECGLLTLTGPGGIGKTRLAIRAAAEAGAHFPAGVAFAALATVRDPERVLATIARALGVRESAGRPLAAALADHLRERRLLLVIDNCEQVLDAAPLLGELLGACPELIPIPCDHAAFASGAGARRGRR
jgi:hypothetical protein